MDEYQTQINDYSNNPPYEQDKQTYELPKSMIGAYSSNGSPEGSGILNNVPTLRLMP